ncbi:hypothetical protein C8R45DRAFT_155335 [Mycena sanguinolenta]|nr:hypothetical protein C8R45DRAFT_155335 [Mycena sanguinolenta]
MQFLILPPELILTCLQNLPLRDLNSCLQCGNRLLRDIIQNSVDIQYRRAQERAGVEENPDLPLAFVSDRLAELQRRQRDWLNFAPRSTHSIALDFETIGVYDLGSDIYFVGDKPDPNTQMCTAIKYIHTSPGSEWSSIDCGKSIIDFGISLEEHDLIAMVTYTPHAQNPRVASIDVMFFKFSTGTSHPLAAKQILHIHDAETFRNRPAISIEIVGQTLALAVVYWNFHRHDADGLHLYNWKSGECKMDSLPIVNTTGFAFLTKDILIVTNSAEDCLDVFYVPDDALPRFLDAFYLPILARGVSIHTFQCRGAPNPRPSASAPLPRSSSASFLARPASAVILYTLQMITPSGASDHMFVLHRARFAALLSRYLAHDPNVIDDDDAFDVQWEEWGPRCTRWLDADELSMQYITTTAGQRMVTIAHNAFQRPAPIRVLDFNPATVADVQCMPADETATATVRVVDPSTQRLDAFANPIASEVSYVEITSTRLFDYGAVLINDQSIIGARFGDRGVESLEVLYFG